MNLKRYFSSTLGLLHRRSNPHLIKKSQILSPPNNKGELSFESLSGDLSKGLNRYELDFIESCLVFQSLDALNSNFKKREFKKNGWICVHRVKEYSNDFTKKNPQFVAIEFKLADFISHFNLDKKQAKKLTLILGEKFNVITQSVKLNSQGGDSELKRLFLELKDLAAQCKQGDMFEDLKLDLTQVKPSRHSTSYEFPTQWL